MIESFATSRDVPLESRDIEICQRVFNLICNRKALDAADERERLAAAIIHSYQDGVTNENSLIRLFS